MVKKGTPGKTRKAVPGCCAVESVIGIDERGQMVLPKELRDKAGIKAGDKFAVVSWEKEGKFCCMSLIRTEELAGMVKVVLGPMVEDISKETKA